jgi:hypothetical protein
MQSGKSTGLHVITFHETIIFNAMRNQILTYVDTTDTLRSKLVILSANYYNKNTAIQKCGPDSKPVGQQVLTQGITDFHDHLSTFHYHFT